MVFAFAPSASVGLRAPVLARSALCGAQVSHAVVSRSAVSMAESSPSVPFLPKPKNLNPDMPGYAGFDPLGFSDLFNIKFLQEAEIKHSMFLRFLFLPTAAVELTCS